MLINNKIVAVKITITIKIIFYNNNLIGKLRQRY